MALLSLGLHCLCCPMGMERCTPSFVGLCVFILPSKDCVFVTGHRAFLPRGLEALCLQRHCRLDLWRGPCARGTPNRLRTENTLRTLQTKEFLPQPLKAFLVSHGLPSLQPWTLSAASSLFAFIPGDGGGNNTHREDGQHLRIQNTDALKQLKE